MKEHKHHLADTGEHMSSAPFMEPAVRSVLQTWLQYSELRKVKMNT